MFSPALIRIFFPALLQSAAGDRGEADRGGDGAAGGGAGRQAGGGGAGEA